MCKFCWALVVVISLALSGLVYKFIISGETVEASDGRQVLLLEPGERDLVLMEMRAFLQSVQQIIASDDMDQVVVAAKAVGAAAQNSVPVSLVKKLPLEFKQLGFDTHQKFDQLALDAESFGGREEVLAQLSELMKNCIACHSIYRIDPVMPSGM